MEGSEPFMNKYSSYGLAIGIVIASRTGSPLLLQLQGQTCKSTSHVSLYIHLTMISHKYIIL